MDALTKIRGSGSRGVLAISVGVVLSLILGFGAFTQLIFVNGIIGEADNFYETLTPVGFMQPQSFFEWIFSFYAIPHLPLSILACYISFKRKETRQIFLPLAISIFVALTIADTGYAIAMPENRPFLLESYLSNLLGSPLIALILCLILLAVKKVPSVLPVSPAVANFIVPLAIGAVLFLVLYVLVKNLFWVTTSKISALMVPPINGNYSAYAVEGGTEKRFGLFLDTEIPPEKLSWKGDALDFGLGIANLDKKASVSAYLLEGCPATKTENAIKLFQKPVFTAHDVSTIGLGTDDGLAELSIHPTSGRSGHWKASEEEASMFSIEAGSDKGTLDLTTFISNKVSVSHVGWKGGVIYRIDAFTIGKKKLTERTFSLRADDQAVAITVEPLPDIDLQGALVCKAVKYDGKKYTTKSMLVTMFLRISYPLEKSIGDIRAPNETFIRGLNGWLYTENVNAEEIGKYINAGSLSYMSVQGKLEELFIDHKQMDTRRNSWLYLQDGEISGAVEGSMLRIEGKTNVAGLDGGRLTKTRWERIEFAVKSLIVSVPAAILFLLSLFWRAWRNNEILIGSETQDEADVPAPNDTTA